MRTGFAGFLDLGVFKNVVEEFGVHFLDGEIVDLFVVFNVPHFKIMERKTVETISLGVDVHRAVVGATEINSVVLPLANVGHGLAPVIDKPLNQRVFLLLNFIEETRWKRTVEPKTHLRKVLEEIDHEPPHFGIVPNGQRYVLLFLAHNGEGGADPDFVILPGWKPELLIYFVYFHALLIEVLFDRVQIEAEHQAVPVFA